MGSSRSKARRRNAEKETAASAYQCALRYFALKAGCASIDELEFQAKDDVTALSILLSVRQMAENEAVKYPPFYLTEVQQ